MFGDTDAGQEQGRGSGTKNAHDPQAYERQTIHVRHCNMHIKNVARFEQGRQDNKRTKRHPNDTACNKQVIWVARTILLITHASICATNYRKF